jgi:outer membrane lipoprotein-sorting protein
VRESDALCNLGPLQSQGVASPFDPLHGGEVHAGRMVNSWSVRMLAAAGCALAWPSAASIAEAAGDATAILAEIDASATKSKDLIGTLKLTIIDKSGRQAKRTLAIWQKGADRRMVKFEAPAPVRGVGLLANGDEGTFLYLPEFGRVRRIVGRSRGDSFFGTDFTNDDMARVKYSKRFSATVESETPEVWQLRLEPKSQRDEPWHHIVIKVRRKDHVVVEAEFHESADGGAIRRLEADDIRVHGSQAIAHKITAFDLKSGRKTLAVLEDVKIDTGLQDSFFTKRHLKRQGTRR